MSAAEANAIAITPSNLRAAANRPCGGERSILLRRAADELETLMANTNALTLSEVGVSEEAAAQVIYDLRGTVERQNTRIARLEHELAEWREAAGGC